MKNQAPNFNPPGNGQSLALGVWCLVFGCFLLVFAPTTAQEIKGGRGENYTILKYHPPPDNTKVQYELSGKKAESLTNGLPGRIALTQLRIVQFNDKAGRLLIEAPTCIYDENAKEASSPGRLQIESGTNQLSLSGEGFLYRNSARTLIISNAVQAIVRLNTNSAPATTNTAPWRITSRWFEFDHTNNHAIFHDAVKGEDAAMKFDCDTLSVLAGTNSRSMNMIEASGNVHFFVKTNDFKLSADHCIYRKGEDSIVLSGNVAWSRGRMSGRADRVTAYQVSRKNSHNIDAEGHVKMKVPREELQAAGGFLSGTNKPTAAKAKPANSELIDVAADRATFISNNVVLVGSVQLSHKTNTLSCDLIEAPRTPAGAPGKTAVATGHVVLWRNEGRVMAERAAYSSSDGQIVFTGEPRWQAPNLEGSAEQLIANTFTNSLFAQNNVVVRYTLEPGSKSLFDFFPNESAPVATTNAPVTIEIKSRTFSAKASDREGIFSGGVRAQQIPADGAQPRLASDSLTLKLTPGGAKSRAESYRAQGNVVIEQGIPGVTNGAATYRRMNADTFTARMLTNGTALDNLVADGNVHLAFNDTIAHGVRATFTSTNQLFVLTGNPTTMTNSQMEVYDAQKLVLDKGHESFRAEGPAKMRVKTEGFKLEGLQPNLQLPTLPKK
ncbi:MAG: hypothetical protein HOP33_23020 [Verrucomicrobia bacterium]|nr:hypothetical protein [Verrucomicrobiota bacterium]